MKKQQGGEQFKDSRLLHSQDIGAGEYVEALAGEKMFLDYKLNYEEMSAIADEIRSHLEYNSVIESSAFLNLPADLQEKIKSHLSESVDNFLSYEDLVALMDFYFQAVEDESVVDRDDRRLNFTKLLSQSIENLSNQRLKGRGFSAKQYQEQQEQNKYSAFADTKRILISMHKFQQLRQWFLDLSQEEKDQVNDYVNFLRQGVKQALGAQRQIQKGVKISKKSGTTSIIGSSARVQDFYNISQEASQDIDYLMRMIAPAELQNREDRFSENEIAKLKVEIKQETDSEAPNQEKINQLQTKLEQLINEAKDRQVAVEDLDISHQEMLDQDTIYAYVAYMKELKSLRRMMTEGEIVVTKALASKIDQAMRVLDRKVGEPVKIVYFHGDFGTGKTALAKHIAKEKFHKDPIVVSGSKYLDPERFTEEYRLQRLSNLEHLNYLRMGLGLEAVAEDSDNIDVIWETITSKDEIRKAIINRYLRENYDALLKQEGRSFDAEEFKQYCQKNEAIIKKEVSEDIESDIDVLFENKIQGRYVMGAMYEAMMKGTPLIIDEANAISPDVLIAFNDLLTKKIGETVVTRTDLGEFKIQPGYCIMFTGNSGDRFKQARYNDIDPAFYSRILPIKIEYLPNTKAGKDTGLDNLLERFNLSDLSNKTFANQQQMLEFVKEKREDASTDQIFQVLLVKLLNNRLGVFLPAQEGDKYKTIKDLYRLSASARILMDLFEGKTQNLPPLPNLDRVLGVSSSVNLAQELKKTNLSMRELIDNILGEFLKDNKELDLEYYIFNFIKSRDLTPKEQGIILAIFDVCGFFNTSEGWGDWLLEAKSANDLNSALNSFDISKVKKYKTIKSQTGDFITMLSKDSGYSLQYINSLEVLQSMFGYLPPVKKETLGDFQKYSEQRKRRESGITQENEELLEIKKAVKMILENLSLLPMSIFNEMSVADVSAIQKDIIKPNVEVLQQFSVDNYDYAKMIESAQNINNFILDMLKKLRMISEEEAENIAGQDIGDAAEAINQILNKNK